MAGGFLGSPAVAAAAAASLQVQRLGWKYKSGRYYFANPPGNNAAAQLTAGRLRLSPWSFPDGVSIAAIGGEVTVVGDVGSTLRLGVYGSDADLFPAALLLDAGTIPGDAVAVAEITLGTPLVLPPGLYWFGAVSQGVTVTDPTVRTAVGTGFDVPIQVGSATPPANTNVVGYSVTGVTGALPGTWASTTTHSTAFRHHIKVA